MKVLMIEEKVILLGTEPYGNKYNSNYYIVPNKYKNEKDVVFIGTRRECEKHVDDIMSHL